MQRFQAPGLTGTFGSLAFSHDLIHQIGGQDDSNRNTTQRMLLLLESRPVSRAEAHARVIRGIVSRYLENDSRPFRWKVPRFLLNDVHRFWRTMCVDYASKYRQRGAKGWAVRNVKLRMSRKLIFAAGLITCFSYDPEWAAERNPQFHTSQTVEGLDSYLVEFTKRTPLDVLAEVLHRHANEGTASTVLDAYDYFLGQIDDSGVRERLEVLLPEKAETDNKYKEIQACCSEFEKALEQLYFEDNPRLARLTREYGVF